MAFDLSALGSFLRSDDPPEAGGYPDPAPRVGFFTIHTGPAGKVLADGRNAHLIQQPSSWWLPKLCERFEIDHLQRTKGGFAVIVSPRQVG